MKNNIHIDDFARVEERSIEIALPFIFNDSEHSGSGDGVLAGPNRDWRSGVLQPSHCAQDSWTSVALIVIGLLVTITVALCLDRPDSLRVPANAQEIQFAVVGSKSDVNALPVDTKRVRGYRLSSDAILALKRLRSLERLELRGSRSADQQEPPRKAPNYDLPLQGIMVISELTKLRNLTVIDATLPNSGLPQLSRLPLLANVRLIGVRNISDRHLDAVGRVRALRKLHIEGWGSLSDSGMRAFERMQGLLELGLLGTYDLSPSGYKHLKKLKKLRVLDLSAPLRLQRGDARRGGGLGRFGPIGANALNPVDAVDDSVLAVVAGTVRSLVSLKLKFRNAISDTGLQQLGNLHQLQHLDLAACRRITDKGLRALPPSIRELNLIGCNGVGEDFPEHLVHLRWLEFGSNGKLNDASVSRICAFPELHHLSLASCSGITKACAKSLAKATKLDYLSLRTLSWVDDAVLARLSTLHELRTLNLTTFDFRGVITNSGGGRIGGRSAITGEGIKKLAQLKKLRELHMATTQPFHVRALRKLGGLPLRVLDIRFNDVEFDEQTRDLAALRRLWPKIDLRWQMPRRR